MTEFTVIIHMTDEFTARPFTSTIRVFHDTEEGARWSVATHIHTAKSFGGYTNCAITKIDLVAKAGRQVPPPVGRPQPWWKGLSRTQQLQGLRDLRLAEVERSRIAHGYAERRLTHVRPVYVGDYR